MGQCKSVIRKTRCYLDTLPTLLPLTVMKQKNSPIIRKRSEHTLSRKDIDTEALKVLYRLSRAGFTAYLVGGSVRDLLLGRKPKDFDVSTSAHPGEIKRLFRNCFLVGRRFRLAHIRFGKKVIETTTFRRQPKKDDQVDVDAHGALVQHQDNTFGTPAEDAMRRDFTINGLFYDISGFSIIDHVGGLSDLEKGVIRSIGDPNIRFREDPVRMIRAVRFSARLEFKISRDCLRATKKYAAELEHCAPSRLYEEVLKLFSYNSSEAAFRSLWSTGILKHMLPEVDKFINRSGKKGSPVFKTLAAFDSEKGLLNEPCNSLLVALLFYPLFREATKKASEHDEHIQHAQIAHESLEPIIKRLKMPRRQMYHAIHILDSQRRFASNNKRFKKGKFVQQEYFPDALDLFRITQRAEKGDGNTVSQWQDLYRKTVSEALPRDDLNAYEPQRSRRRRPRRNRKNVPKAPSPENS